MNLVVISGRLSKEPELKYLPNSGTPLTTFDIAVERSYSKNKEDNKNNVDYFMVQCWGNLADCVANNLEKGRRILVNGILKNNHWKDENNNFHRNEIIIARTIEFLDYPKNNSKDKFEFEPVDMDSVEGEMPF